MNKIPALTNDTTITLVAHEATTGPVHDLRDFLLAKHIKQLLFIAHPLLYIPQNYKNSSRYELFRNGKKIKEQYALHWKLPELVLYMKDCLYTLVWELRENRNTDIYIGYGNINALIGVLLKKIGAVKKVIFYCIDYVPKRFNNPVINNVYHVIDKWAVEGSDMTWNLSARMQKGREEKWGKLSGRQITVPIGIWYERISKEKLPNTNPHEIIYLGTLLEKQGLDICLKAIQIVRKKISDITLTIIGSGPDKERLEQLVKTYKLEKHIKFLGYLPSHKDVEKRLSQAALAVALYNPHIDTFSYYADPGKVKSYLACGLPVMITNVPQIAEEIKKRECGIVVDFDVYDISNQIEKLFSNKKDIQRYKINARKFAKEFDWEKIFSKVMNYVIE